MLHRIVYASRAVGPTGASALSIAQILGQAQAENRRRHITGCLLFHEGHILQVLEGARVDLDRLMGELRRDPRHADLRVLSDLPIPARAFDEPMTLCGAADVMLRKIGVSCLSLITRKDVAPLVDLARAA